MINRAGAFLLTAAVFVLIALVSVFQIEETKNKRLRQEETLQQAIISAAQTALSTIKDVETGQRGFLLSGQAPYLQPYLDGLNVLDQNLNNLRALASKYSDSAALVAAFEEATRKKISELKNTVELRVTGYEGLALARLMQGEGLRYMNEARSLENKLVQLEQQRIAQTRKQVESNETVTRASMVTGWIIFLLLLTAGTVMLARETERESKLKAGLERSEQRYRQLAESLEQKIQERTQELQAVNAELESFSFSVSHDLRAPLRSIDGFSHIILEDYGSELNEEGRGMLERIRTATAQMGQLIKSLLELSRVNRGDLRREPVSLSSMADAIVEGYRILKPERQVEVRINRDLAAKGDPELLRVVLDNLLSNAWKFTSKEMKPSIEVGSVLIPPSGPPAFFVKDNGTGFDPAYADRLFTPFQRLHSTAQFEGVGIGLATVKRVIHRHGGDIWATSAPGRGATFFFTVP